MHFIVFPLSLIVPSIFEEKTTMAISFIVAFVTFVPSSLRDLFFDKLQLKILLVIIMKEC